MKKLQHSKIRNIALGAVAGAAIAFSALFSPNTALAKGENCSSQIQNGVSKKDVEWEGKGRTCGSRKLKNFVFYFKKPEDKKTIIVKLDCKHIKTQYEQSYESFEQMLQNNIDHAQKFYELSVNGKWHCLGAPSAERRIMPDDTQDKVETPKPTVKVQKPKLTSADKAGMKRADTQFRAAKKSIKLAEKLLKKNNLFKARLALIEATKKVTDGLQSIYPVFDLLDPIEKTIDVYPLVQDSNATQESLRQAVVNLYSAVLGADTKNMAKAEYGFLETEQDKRKELDQLRENIGKTITSGHAPAPERRIMPEEEPKVEKQGKWRVITRFGTNPPKLRNGKPYSTSSPISMLNDNKPMIKNIFERVLKRDADVGGKVMVKITVGSAGKATKIAFSGEKINDEIVQKFAELFGRVRWSESGTVRFPLILNSSN